MVSILSQYCINVSDLERSIEFWEGVIGIPVQSRTDIPNVKEAVLQSPAGGSRMQLAQHLDQEGPIDMGTAMWKLYVNTDDCVALYDKAIAAGCESVALPSRLERWPVTMAYVKDFDGYLVEFVEYHEGTPPGRAGPQGLHVAPCRQWVGSRNRGRKPWCRRERRDQLEQPGNGPSLTVDKVLATAMTMIEESGVEAFSMRKLAAELGVGTPTVYWHVGNRDELFNRLIGEITDQFGSISPRGRTPAERIASISNALLREVRAHPQLIALSKTQGRGEAIFTKAQAVLAHELTASGLHGEGGGLCRGDHSAPSGRFHRARGCALTRLPGARGTGMGSERRRDRRDHEHHAAAGSRPRQDLSVHTRCHPPVHSRGSERVSMNDRLIGRAIDTGIVRHRTWTARVHRVQGGAGARCVGSGQEFSAGRGMPPRSQGH